MESSSLVVEREYRPTTGWNQKAVEEVACHSSKAKAKALNLAEERAQNCRSSVGLGEIE